MQAIANALAFQVGWFACVLGAANGSTWIGAAAMALVIGLHLWHADDRPREATLIILSGIIGLIGEGALMTAGAVSYASPGPLPDAPPAWLIALWFGFATLMNVSMAWLKDRLAVALVLGLIFGPLSYIAGERLGGMTILEPRMISVAAIAALWAVALPLLAALAKKFNGFHNA